MWQDGHAAGTRPGWLSAPWASMFTVSGCPATGVTLSGGFRGTSTGPSCFAETGPAVALAITLVPAAIFA